MKVSRSAKKSKPSSSVKKSVLKAPLLMNIQENVKPARSSKLIITNLDKNVSDGDICELFSEIGTIREVAVHYNCWGYSLGTAHVVYLNSDHASEAARRYNGVPFDGRPMIITLEGTPHGLYHNGQPSLPVKMRLSFGPNQQGTKGKTTKRLQSGAGPKHTEALGPIRGRLQQRGRPAIRGARRPLTAAELDMELDDYLSKSKQAKVSHSDEGIMDDFGNVMNVDLVPKTPKGSMKTKTGRTPKTANTPVRTPVRLSRTTPGKGSKTPGKGSKITPAKFFKFAKTTPGKTPKVAKTPKSANTTPAKIDKTTPAKSPKTAKTTPAKSPKTAKTPSESPKTVKTPAKSPKTVKTPAKSPKTVKTPAKSPKTVKTPAKSPKTVKTPAKSPKTAKTPAKSPKTAKTPSKSPKTAKTPSKSPKTVRITPAKTIDLTPGTTPKSLSGKKSKSTSKMAENALITPAKTPEVAPAKTPEVAPADAPLYSPVNVLSEITLQQPNFGTPAKQNTPSKSPEDIITGTPNKIPAKSESKMTPARRRIKTRVARTPAKTEGEADENDSENIEPLPSLPKSVKKDNPRRSGRFSRI